MVARKEKEKERGEEKEHNMTVSLREKECGGRVVEEKKGPGTNHTPSGDNGTLWDAAQGRIWGVSGMKKSA